MSFEYMNLYVYNYVQSLA